MLLGGVGGGGWGKEEEGEIHISHLCFMRCSPAICDLNFLLCVFTLFSENLIN